MRNLVLSSERVQITVYVLQTVKVSQRNVFADVCQIRWIEKHQVDCKNWTDCTNCKVVDCKVTDCKDWKVWVDCKDCHDCKDWVWVDCRGGRTAKTARTGRTAKDWADCIDLMDCTQPAKLQLGTTRERGEAPSTIKMSESMTDLAKQLDAKSHACDTTAWNCLPTPLTNETGTVCRHCHD